MILSKVILKVALTTATLQANKLKINKLLEHQGVDRYPIPAVGGLQTV